MAGAVAAAEEVLGVRVALWQRESRTRAEACRAVDVSRALKQAGRAGRCRGQSGVAAGHPSRRAQAAVPWPRRTLDVRSPVRSYVLLRRWHPAELILLTANDSC